MSGRPDDKVGVNWLLVVGTAVFGLVLVAAPYLLDRWFGGFGEWKPITSSTLTNVGTALLLAAGLFFIERGFTKRIRKVVSDTATEAVQSEVQQVREEAQEMERRVNLRIDGVQERFEDLQERAAEGTEAVFADLEHDLSFESVTRALEEANDIRALHGGRLSVPAGATDKPPHVTFWWGEHQGYMLEDLEADYALELQYEANYYPGDGGVQVARILWAPTQQPEEALLALREEMVRAGFGAAAQKLDGVAMFSALLATLRDAVASKRAHDDAWFKGEACDLVADGVIVTARGLEMRGKGIVVRSNAFPSWPGSAPSGAKKPWPPAAPPGVNQDLWGTALYRGRKRHPGRTGGPRFAGPTAFTKANSPHNA